MTNLITELRTAAKSSGMTQTELAKRLNITQPSVWLFLNGGGLSGDVLLSLMEILGYRVVKPKKQPSRLA